MNTPQERVAEYLQKHYSGGEGWPPMHHAAEICKLVSSDCGKELLERLNKLEAESAAMREVIEHAGCHDHGDGDERDCSLYQAVNSILDSTNAGKSMLDRLHAMDDKLKTAASMLRYAIYDRTPLGDQWIDHFDFERQKAITEFLSSVEGKDTR